MVQGANIFNFGAPYLRHYRVGQLGTIAYLPAAYPVCIDLPGIRQRSVEEQLELIVSFFQRESRKIERTISLDKTLLHWLLSKPRKAISKLKSDIQFLCAGVGVGMTERNDTLELDKRLAEMSFNTTPEQRLLVDALFGGKDRLNVDARTLPALKFVGDQRGNSRERPVLQFPDRREYVNLRNSNVPPAETLAILKNKLSSILNMVFIAAIVRRIHRAMAIKLRIRVTL